MLQVVIFTIVVIPALAFAARQYMHIRQNILLGKDEDLSDHKPQRWRNMLLFALGQRKMFKRFIPAILHFFIYTAFLITQVELIEIFADGFTGRHRVFASSLGGFYTFVINFIEILSLLALFATVIFLIRRNILHVRRFEKPEMEGWPKLDANLILFGEILLIIGIFSMNGADVLLQNLEPQHYPETGRLLISDALGPVLFGGLSANALEFVEQFGWWLHLLVVLGFLNYLPISKHLHLLLAFPNSYFARLTPPGKMENMPEVMNEVKSMMDPEAAFAEAPAEEELPTFGANDVFSLSWKNILEAYTCTECGRCTDECPANQTGKKLSPRHIVMAVRDRAEEVGKKLRSGDKQYIREDLRAEADKLTKENFDDGRSLFDYIEREELHACTTCMACVEACPVLIRPLEVILEMRRYEILMESAGPSDWLPLFNSIENSGSAWAMSQPRDAWVQE